MKARLRVAVGCEDLGRRVSVRMRLSSGGFSDVLGILEGCDDAVFLVRDRSGRLRRLPRDEIVAAKVVPPAAQR